MHSKNEFDLEFCTGELVRHRRSTFTHVGIVINVKTIFDGYDVQVLWPEGRIANHHSNCLEII